MDLHRLFTRMRQGLRGGPAAELEEPGEARALKPGFAEEALPCLDAVYRFALRLTRGDEEEAQELVQETFLRAYRLWESYTPGTKCLSWLFTICRNVAIQQAESRGRRAEAGAADLGAPDVEALASTTVYSEIRAADPERAFFDSFVDEEVMRAIDRLPADFREAVVLSDLEGLAYGEIAETLGVPIGTVKSRIYRGRRLLQEVLYEYAVDLGYIRGGPTNV